MPGTTFYIIFIFACLYTEIMYNFTFVCVCAIISIFSKKMKIQKKGFLSLSLSLDQNVHF